MTCFCCGAPLEAHEVLIPEPPPLVRCPRKFTQYGPGEPAVQRFGSIDLPKKRRRA